MAALALRVAERLPVAELRALLLQALLEARALRVRLLTRALRVQLLALEQRAAPEPLARRPKQAPAGQAPVPRSKNATCASRSLAESTLARSRRPTRLSTPSEPLRFGLDGYGQNPAPLVANEADAARPTWAAIYQRKGRRRLAPVHEVTKLFLSYTRSKAQGKGPPARVILETCAEATAVGYLQLPPKSRARPSPRCARSASKSARHAARSSKLLPTRVPMLRSTSSSAPRSSA